MFLLLLVGAGHVFINAVGFVLFLQAHAHRSGEGTDRGTVDCQVRHCGGLLGKFFSYLTRKECRDAAHTGKGKARYTDDHETRP